MKMLKIFIFLCLFFTWTEALKQYCQGQIETIDENSTNNLDRFHLIYKSIQRALNYFSKFTNIYNANLDAAIGTRILEGILFKLIKIEGENLPKPICFSLVNLYFQSKSVSDHILNQVIIATPIYFNKIDKIIQANFWNGLYPIGKLRWEPWLAPVNQEIKYEKTLTEQISDDCLHELYGGEKHQSCNISKYCWNIMTNNWNFSSYALTHQLFYLENGIQAGCYRQMKQNLLKSPSNGISTLEGLANRICSKIYVELQNLLQTKREKDLILEQIGLCGYYGYLEFADYDILPLLLSWQKPSGCLGLDSNAKSNITITKANRYGRQKRVETYMGGPDLCLSHGTSVMLTAFSIYLRKSVMEFL